MRLSRLAFLSLFAAAIASAQGLPIKSGSSTNLLDVDTNNSAKVRVVDAAANTINVLEGHLKVGQPTMLMYDPVEGSTLQTNIWTGTATTATITVGTGVLNLNASGTNTANTNAAIISIKQFNLQEPEAPVIGMTTFMMPTGAQANQQIEFGFSDGTAATAATNGCFFMWNAAGELRAYLYTNSTPLQSAALSAPAVNVTHSMYVEYKYDECSFFIDDVNVANITQTGTGSPSIAGKLPLFARTLIAAATPAVAPKISFYNFTVLQENIDMSRDYRNQMVAGAARGAYQSPASTYTQTSNHANSTSPTSATLSNTAAGYTTLGGRYQFAAPAGATTDFALFGYQVPAGFQLHVTGVGINACNTGAAVATTPTLLDWGIAVNSSAVSLATADALGPPPTTWQPRRIPLGMQGIPLTAPNGPLQIGDCMADIVRTFDPPLVVDSARFFHVIVQVPVGTATASQVVRGDVMVNGWFE